MRLCSFEDPEGLVGPADEVSVEAVDRVEGSGEGGTTRLLIGSGEEHRLDGDRDNSIWCSCKLT